MSLTKADIIDSIFTRLDYSRSRAVSLLETTQETIKATRSDWLSAIRNQLNTLLNMGYELTLGASGATTFRCSSVLKNKMNGSSGNRDVHK